MTLFDNSFYKSNFYLVQTKTYEIRCTFVDIIEYILILLKEYLVSLHIEDATFVDDEIIDFFNYFKIEFQAPPIALKSTPLLLNPPCGRLTFMTLRQKLSLLFTT